MSIKFSSPRWAGLALCLMVVGISEAQAQTQAQAPSSQTGDSVQPGASRAFTLADVPGLAEALQRPLIHSLRIDLDRSYGDSKSKRSDQPDRRESTQTILATGFRVADVAFGQIALSWDNTEGKATNSAANGGLRYDSDTTVTALSFSGGYLVTPDLAVGLTLSRNRTNGYYQLVSAGSTPTNIDGDGTNWGPFVSYTLPPLVDKLTLTANTAYNKSSSDVAYDNNNNPPRDESWVNIWTNTLTGHYSLNADWRLQAGVSWSHITGQKRHVFQEALDRDWLTLSAGIAYQITDHIELRLTAATWTANTLTDYRQIGFGVGYRF